MAGSFLVKKGGGSAIKGIVESYKIKAGETINAGDFVDYVNSQDLTLGSPNIFSNNIFGGSIIALTNDIIMAVYIDEENSGYGTVVIGTISGSSVSFGSPTVFNSASTSITSAVALGSDKIVVNYRNSGNSSYGTSIIGTISGSSISFGSPTVFNSADTRAISAVALGSDKIVVSYRNEGNSSRGTSIVGTISGSSISFGSPTVFNSVTTDTISAVALGGDKIVVSYRNGGNSSYGTSIVGTISESSISFGSPTVFNSANTFGHTSTLALSSDKIVVSYRNGGNSNYGTSIVGTVSGSSISFGSPTVFNSASTDDISAVALSNDKIVINYTVGVYVGTSIVGTISGSSISFGSPVTFSGSSVFSISTIALSYNKLAIIYTRYTGGTSYLGTVLIGYFDKLLISATEDVFGVAKKKGTGGEIVPVYIDQTARPFKLDELVQSYKVAFGQNISAGTFVDYINNGQSISYLNGSPTVFNSATTIEISAVALSSDKIVISYRNFGNSGHGTSIVGTVSGSSISFGSPIVFNSANTIDISAVVLYSDKIVVSYRNSGNSSYGTSIVGTISGLSISFGSPTVFNSATTFAMSAVALGNDKIVVSYRNSGNSFYGTSIIGTISGSSISFGSPTVFNSADTFFTSAVALGSDKIVIGYRNSGNSFYGTVIVGTISGSSISFGSPTVFNSAESGYISAVALSSDKIVVSYRNGGNSFYGTSIIGTISGLSISFGSPAVFNSASTDDISAVALGSDKIVVSYHNDGNSSYGTSIVGTISGLSISFGSPTVFNSAGISFTSAVALSSDKIVVSYNTGNSQYGTFIVGEIEKLIIPTDTNIFGVAKTDGISGEIVDVYVKNN
jgi:hypothetical protein